MDKNNNTKPIPEPSEFELLKVQELGINSLTTIGHIAASNPFQYLLELQKLFVKVYTDAYKSGYRQSEIDSILK